MAAIAQSYAAAVHLAEDVKPFFAIDKGLRERGFSAPEIHHSDLEAGFLITEDFGSAPVVEGDPPAPILDRYEAATDVLAALHREPLPEVLPLVPPADYPIPVFDIDAWMVEVGLMLEWYMPDRGVTPGEALRSEFDDDVARDPAKTGGGPQDLGDPGLSLAQPDLAWRPRRPCAGRHHRFPGRRAGACGL